MSYIGMQVLPSHAVLLPPAGRYEAYAVRFGRRRQRRHCLPGLPSSGRMAAVDMMHGLNIGIKPD